MKTYFHDQFLVPLPRGHRFPIEKYALLRHRILDAGLVPPLEFCTPQAASDDDLLLVHTPAYLEKVILGRLSPQEIRRIGFPWSPELVERSRRSVGSTIAVCKAALDEGVAVNLAGGTHHAHPAFGEGFCIFNDAAVGARVVQREKLAHRIAVIDCDVHQGDGTAAVFATDPSVYTFSIHGAKNFPFRKVSSDLDLPLPDGTGDTRYLEALDTGLRQALAAARADLVIYLAGADPYIGDRLGRLSLTKAGLLARDRLVFDACQRAGLPVAVVMGGGYGHIVADTVEIHFQTVQLALERYVNGKPKRSPQ